MLHRQSMIRLRHKMRRALGMAKPMAPVDHRDDTPPPDPQGLEKIFWENEGHGIHKWLHYFPIYESHFARFIGTDVRVLEVGVENGGSMAMWRKWLGDKAQLHGIDIDPACAKADGISGRIHIGSQADTAFVAKVIDEMGGVDIVIDDGSHVMEHIHATLEVAFPKLSNGGVYLIEDLHCAYYPNYGGGYGAQASIIETAKMVVDDMHRWYHPHGEQVAATRGHVSGVHFYDSVIVLDKDEVKQPVRAVTGKVFVHDD